MKPQSRNLSIIVLFFLSLLNSFAQNDINKLFFNLPLESSRDSIYSSIKKYGFIEESSNTNISQDDEITKTFYGYLNIKPLGETSTDSIKIQLSTGSSSIENDKYYQSLLILWTYYHFSNVKTAKNFYRTKQNEIKKIMSEEPYHSNNYFKDGNVKVKTGYSDKFYDEDGDRVVSIKFEKERQEYIVILEYQRNEGEKKIRKQLIPKKELIFREVESQNLFQIYNVEQVPITKECSTRNNHSIECFKNTIVRHISDDVDFKAFGLTSGAHRFFSTFTVDKNAEIINIRVSHTNSQLCEEIMNSINQINIVQPAINKGIKVAFLAQIPLTITIEQ